VGVERQRIASPSPICLREQARRRSPYLAP
jgi:hypothetical protein